MNKALFVHGWATDSEVWKVISGAFSTSTERGLLTPNLPGHGSAARWLEPSLNPALINMAKLLSNEEEGIWGLGWSLGAEVLLSLAARFPKKFSALVLVGATPCFVKKADFPYGQSRALVRRMILDMKARPEETLNRFYPLNFTEKELSSEAAVDFMERYAPPGPIICDGDDGNGPSSCHQAFNYRDITTGLEALYNTDIRGLLKDINIPVLLIHGSDDSVVPIEAAEFTANNIKRASMEVVPHAGHAPFITSEGRFVEAVMKFLRAVDR